MEDARRLAVDIIRAQASVRPMTAEEMAEMLDVLTSKLDPTNAAAAKPEQDAPYVDPKTSVREKSVICCECGKTFKVLSKKHLETHGMTTEEYRAKYGIKKGTALVAKSLVRDRRNKMKEMKLWERRKPMAKPSGPRVESKFPGREEADI